MSHFDEMTCLLYLDGQLDALRAGEVSLHARSCSSCRNLLAALERESGLLQQAMLEEEEGVPARLLAPPAPDNVPWGWIATLGLACAGAYTFYLWFYAPLQSNLDVAGFGQGGLLTMLFFSGAFWKGWGDMTTLLQVLAMMILGIPAGWLVLRQVRRMKPATAMVLATLAAFLCLPSPVSAAEIKRHQAAYTLPAGETVKNDLIVAAGSVRIDGTVEGDLISFGENLTITGHVTGDIIAFGQRIKMEGQVDGNVRAVGNTLDIAGSVGKNVMVFAQNVYLADKAKVGGSLTVFTQALSLDGHVDRDVLAFVDKTTVNGVVGGSLNLQGGNLTVGSGAEIKGPAKFEGVHEPEVSPQAKLASAVKYEKLEKSKRPDYTSFSFYWRKILKCAAAFFFGLMLWVLWPGFFTEAARSTSSYGLSLGLGLLALVAMPVLAVIACITIVGLAVGIGALLFYALLLYAAQVFVAVWVGQHVVRRQGDQALMPGASTGGGALIGALAVGLPIIYIIGSLPYVGGWFWFGVVFWGLGAMVLSIVRRVSPAAVAA